MSAHSHPEYDVIVVGAGMAGYAAAISASESGASVLLLEKMSMYGGSTAWSGGAFCFAGTPEQAAAGIEDNRELLRANLTQAGDDKTRPELIDLYVERQLEIYQWLKSLGVPFASPVLSPGQALPRSHSTSTRPMLKLLHEHFTGRPHCHYLAEAEVTRIDRDENGIARIVRARIEGEPRTIAARRAVVLATGGFARSNDLFERLVPWLSRAKRLGGEGSTGDGFRMGIALGADFADFGWMEGTFGAVLPNYPSPSAWVDNDTQLLHAVYAGGIILNKQGRRFIDESLSYRKLGNACLEQPDAVAFQLFDQSVMESSRHDPITRNFKGAFEKGLARQAATPGEAATLMGLPADIVEQEVAEYNRGIATGREPAFGRSSLLNGQGTPHPLVRAPFYIYACTTGISATYAGLLANRRMALLNVYGEEVPGVFVAGELVGGFHGPLPVSGTAICKAAIFGRTAGESAARFTTPADSPR
jgi:fumarate reductase flavoprotein subunit